MKRRLTWFVLSACALSVWLLSGCASADKPSIRRISLESRNSLESGDFQKAIEPFKESYQRNPGDKRLEAAYAQALEDIHRAADQALAKPDHSLAGNIYGVLIQNYPDAGGLASRLTFTKSMLEEKLKNCRSASADLQYRQHLKTGGFAMALDSFLPLLKDYPGDADIAAIYAQALRDIHLMAEQALARRDHALAGNLYGILLKRFPDFGTSASRLTFTKASLEEKLKRCRFASGDLQYQEHMKSGNFAMALDSYAVLLREYPRDQDLAARYIKAANEIKSEGDKALTGKDFSRAGGAFSELQNKYATFTGTKPAVGFSRDELEKGISACRTILKNKGFTEYRKGNLDKAVAAWESLLAFDPDNAEVLKAVETAKSQMRKLKK